MKKEVELLSEVFDTKIFISPLTDDGYLYGRRLSWKIGSLYMKRKKCVWFEKDVFGKLIKKEGEVELISTIHWFKICKI